LNLLHEQACCFYPGMNGGTRIFILHDRENTRRPMPEAPGCSVDLRVDKKTRQP